MQWRSCEVNGSVTSICLDDSFVVGDVSDTGLLMVEEQKRCGCVLSVGNCGCRLELLWRRRRKCSVFRSVEGADVLQLCSEFVRR